MTDRDPDPDADAASNADAAPDADTDADAGTDAGTRTGPGPGTSTDADADVAPDGTFRLALEEVRPSQLYLSAAKLASVLGEFDFDDPHGSYDPLPVFEREGAWYLSDGHTRAFVAHLAGVDELRVRRDADLREEYDMDLYYECIRWCEEAGVWTVADFAGRVLAHDTYEAEWIDRCRRAADRLES